MNDDPGKGPEEHATPIRPEQLPKQPPCQAGCLSGTDIRGWITMVAQRRRLGLTDEEAYTRAWRMIVDKNPFPAVMGRICPHPCEAGCNRRDKDGAVSVNQLERFLGDWGLAHDKRLERLETDAKPDSIGVIGSGPAGLSFAYQMARRGYRVTVYESSDSPGGMLRYGVPDYRLPAGVLDAEIARITALGVEFRLGRRVGRDPTVEEIESRHDVVFLGIGAHRGLRLGVSGERGPGAWIATEYLRRANGGERIDLGSRVAVVGGGNTAIDAARVARRKGAEVHLLYRRTRKEMPARQEEVEEAIREGVQIVFLVGPSKIERDSGTIRAVVVQRMRLGAPDASGRRSPRPVDGSTYSIPIDAVIAAVSQEPEWKDLQDLRPEGGWVRTDGSGRLSDRLWAAGDVAGPGSAGMAIGRARLAAEAIHARLRGRAVEPPTAASSIRGPTVRPEYYPRKPRTQPRTRPQEEWLERPGDEIHLGLTEKQFQEEVARCLSCGQCFGCEHCWMYCVHDCFTRLDEVRPGAYFSLAIDQCQACGKCIDVCPCGFLEVRQAPDA
jgi:NADPH-dependent glutamate synthase beta subunit-like oxidoreductase